MANDLTAKNEMLKRDLHDCRMVRFKNIIFLITKCKLATQLRHVVLFPVLFSPAVDRRWSDEEEREHGKTDGEWFESKIDLDRIFHCCITYKSQENLKRYKSMI